MTLIEPDTVVSATWTGLLAHDLDVAQPRGGGGPGVHAAVSGEPEVIADMRRETRWPKFTAAAITRGAMSSLSMPIPIRHDVQASLNVYAHGLAWFGGRAQSTARALAGAAAAAISTMTSYDETRRTAEQRQAAMASRSVIEQATGILMGRHGLDAEEAFRLLATQSKHTNRKVRELAAELISGVRAPAMNPRDRNV